PSQSRRVHRKIVGRKSSEIIRSELSPFELPRKSPFELPPTPLKIVVAISIESDNLSATVQ
ncbi:MAG: hypothetical protein ABSA69_02520, partial [Verrucomicrobiota bacterium]